MYHMSHVKAIRPNPPPKQKKNKTQKIIEKERKNENV